MPALADSHIHLDDPRLDPDRDHLIQAARAAGISAQIIPATTRHSWAGIEALIHRYPGLYPAYGLHPCFLPQHDDKDVTALADWLQARPGQAVAIGEIGLDFHAPEASAERQQWLFQRQLDLAAQLNLPVIIHARRAMDAVIAQLRRRPGLRGVIHAFAGSEQQAQQLWALGFYLGIGGTVTYPRAQRLRRILASMPAELMLLETDAPDQPVAGHQGERNLPVRLLNICHSLAELRCSSPAAIADQTWRNTCRLFALT